MKEKCAFLAVLYLLSSSQTTFTNDIKADEILQTKMTPAIKSAPIIIYNQRLFTRVSLNGRKEVNFFVDNGWHQTTVDSRIIDEESFTPVGEVAYRAMHKRGQKGVIGLLSTIKVGDLEISNVEAMSTDIFLTLSKNLRYKVNGVLGYEIIKPYLTTFDFRKKRIHFAPNTPEAVAAIEEHKDMIALPFGPTPLPEASNHLFSVELQVNGRPVDAIVDLGFPGCIFTSVSHTDLGVYINFASTKTEISVIGQRGPGYQASAKEVRVGDHVERNVKVLYLASKVKPKITLLGVAFLKKFNMTLDYKNGTLYLVPHSSRCSDKYFRLEPCVR